MELMKSVDVMVTSLELLEEINLLRDRTENKKELEHVDLLKVVINEFDEEISEGSISFSSYEDKNNQNRTMFDLTISQAKQVLVRESKIVRKAVIKRLDEIVKPKTRMELAQEQVIMIAEIERLESENN